MKTIKIVLATLIIGVFGVAHAQTSKQEKKENTPKKTVSTKPKNVMTQNDKTNKEKAVVKTESKTKKTPAQIKQDKINSSNKKGDGSKMKEIKRPVAKPK